MRTKPAVPIGGRYRLIDIALSNCIHSDITRVFILTQFLPASLHRHVQRTYQFDVFSGGAVEILPAEQDANGMHWYEGTADAVRRQMTRIRSRSPKDLIVLSGDHLYRMDYDAFVRTHRESGADVTIAVLPVPADEASRYGILKTDDSGRVIAFQEKPQGQELLDSLQSRPGDALPFLASMGIYAFRIESLIQLLDEVEGNDFGRHVLPAAIERTHVHTFRFEGYWEDIGTIGAFYEANLALTRPNPPFDFYAPKHPIYTHSRFLPSSRIDGCTIDRTIVADGCRLYDARIEDCVIGLRSIVLPGAHLSNVVMMGADYYETEEERVENRRLPQPHVGVGHDTRIERAIIDKNARIGRNVAIRSHAGEPDRDLELYSIRDGIVVIPKNTVIPDGTTI
jgi:glucose-1-phosphate adenylyltransferase